MRSYWLAGGAAACLVACRSPTQIDVVVTTNVACAQVMGTSLTSGTLGAIENLPATTTSSTCSGTNIGSVVLLPSGQDDALVGFKVVTAIDGEGIDGCVPDDAGSYGAHCIVARRALRYLPHTPLTVDVLMSGVCAGISCDPLSTCVEGACVPATITDPSACEGSGCSEQVLSPDGGEPQDATLPPEGGGADATVTDAPADAPANALEDSSPLVAEAGPGVPGCDLGGAQPGAVWPMSDYCPTHRNRSPFVGPSQAPHLLWYQNLPGGTLGAPAVGADGTVYIGATGVVDAFEPTEGGLIWQYVSDAGGLYQGTPLLAADYTVRVLDENVVGSYVSLPMDGGAPFVTPSPGSLNFRGGTTIIGDGTMYASAATSALVAIGALGQLVWATPGVTTDFVFPTVASDGTVLTTTQDVFAMYADGGGVRWTTPTDASQDMVSVAVAVDGSLRVGSPDDGILYAFTADGSPMWSVSIPNNPGASALLAVADDGTTYAGGSTGIVAWSATGTNAGTFAEVACGQPIIDAAGNVYDWCDGVLYGLDSHLNQRWSLQAPFGQGQTVNDSPVLGPGGMIYMSTDTENPMQTDGGPADAVMAFGP